MIETTYTTKIANQIIKQYATTTKSLAQICDDEENVGFPTRQTFYNWMNERKGLFDKFIHARKKKAHVLDDSIIEVANDDSRDVLESVTEWGVQRSSNSAAVQRDNLKINVYKRYAGTVQRRLYSDETVVNFDSNKSITDNLLELRNQFSRGHLTAEQFAKSADALAKCAQAERDIMIADELAQEYE